MMTGLILDRSGCSPLMSHSCPELGSLRMHCMVSFFSSSLLRLVTFLAPITHFSHLAGYGRCFIVLCADFYGMINCLFCFCRVVNVRALRPLHSHRFAFVILSIGIHDAPASRSSIPLPSSEHSSLTLSLLPNMSSKGWLNLETAAGTIPETQFFEGDSAFKSLGLSRTQRLYGFGGWCVLQFDTGNPFGFGGPGCGHVLFSPLLMTCNSAWSTVTPLD
jgi:hypothetical protein